MTDPLSPAATRRADQRGTAVIVAGTAASAVGVLLYEIIARRALDDAGFAPIAVLWTVGFIVFTVLMLPIEQFITRTLVIAGGDERAVARHAALIAAVLAAATVAGVAFSAVTADRFFPGHRQFVLVVAGLLVTRSALATARGFLAGRRRFAAYGLAVGLEGTMLVLGALVAATADAPAPVYGWVMAFAPLTVFLLRPFHRRHSVGPQRDEQVSASYFLGWLLVATAAAQLILAGGPIVVGFVGGSALEVSIFFVTFTLFRGPITSAYNLVARVLPDFTAMASDHRIEDLHRWARRLVVGGAGFAAITFLAAFAIGPQIVATVFGPDNRPSALVAGLGGGGVGAGLAVLFIHQIYVARGHTKRLAMTWLAALGLAAVIVAFLPADPIERVAAGFAAGELGALVVLGFAASLDR
jgi:O-antigen/teichoic acid export membrane protein